MRWFWMFAAVAVASAACLSTGSTPARDTVANTEPGEPSGAPSKSRLDRRPLHLPRLQASGQCPRTSGGVRAKAVAIALGHGPVYPVLGMSTAPPRPGGIAALRSDFHVFGWYLHKTLWAISPRYLGPVLIRGERIDRRGLVRFGGDAACRALSSAKARRRFE